MTPAEVLEDAYGRVLEVAEEVLDGIGRDDLDARLDAEANPIGWLIWHLTRVLDDHVATVAGTEQVYTSQGFAQRFALPLDDRDIGYGHTSEQVATVRADAGLLLDYLRAAHQAAVAYVRTVTEADLDRVVDARYDPPVTLGVRLVSVVNDCTQHVGQASFVRGVLTRR